MQRQHWALTSPLAFLAHILRTRAQPEHWFSVVFGATAVGAVSVDVVEVLICAPLPLICRVDYRDACPGWKHMLWTDDNISELKYLDMKFYNQEATPNGKSDILRAAIVYEYGGVYIDADSQWVNNMCLDDFMLLASDTGFIAAIEPGKTWAASGVIGAVRHHPVSKLYQQAQVILSTGGRGGAPWQRLGPLGVSAAMTVADNHASSQHCLANVGSKIVLTQQDFDENIPAAQSWLMTSLHSKYFYPTSWNSHSMSGQMTNLMHVAELVKAKYPEAAMYQLGFTTHGFKPRL